MKSIPRVLLSLETSRSYGRSLIRGICAYARANGPWSLTRRIEFYREQFSGEKSEKSPLYWLADGIIMREEESLSKLQQASVPVIIASYINADTGQIPAIVTNCRAIGQIGARHFLERNFHNFAFCGLSDMYWSKRRSDSFAEEIGKAGFETSIYQQADANLSWDKEQFAIAEWIDSLEKPVAIMACNDDRALEIVEACKISGWKVPDDVAVLGVDNDDIVCETSHPPISSVTLDIENAGYNAAALLDRLMSGEKMSGQQIVIEPTQIACRPSTDVFAVEDQDVASAINFIRLNVNTPIQVEDVTSAIGISPRNLYDKFIENLGRTVYDEITRVKIEHISRLLLETNMTILQIARSLGYPTDKHLSRYFSRQRGISPLAFRKKYGRTYRT